MSRKTGECTLRLEDAAELLGIDAQSLRLCLQHGYYGDIGRALKTSKNSECFIYEISKFKLYQYLGLDVSYSIEETLKLIKNGNPPYIKQAPISLSEVMVMMDARIGLKKDTSTSTKQWSV